MPITDLQALRWVDKDEQTGKFYGSVVIIRSGTGLSLYKGSSDLFDTLEAAGEWILRASDQMMDLVLQMPGIEGVAAPDWPRAE